jgi:hypothetical protein
VVKTDSSLVDLRAAARKLRDYRAGGKAPESDIVAALNQACDRDGVTVLAAGIGVSKQYLSDVRRGRRAVSDKLLVAIIGSNHG